MTRNPWLLAGGVLSASGALLHLSIIAGGADWYRAFGAGERMARLAERGAPGPAMITAAIASLLAVAAAYAFSGAGIVGRLPLMRTALLAISAVYLARGLFVFRPSTFGRPDLSAEFMLWSSLIVLALGLLYAIGTWQAWPQLSRKDFA
jgi:hypothetical protein